MYLKLNKVMKKIFFALFCAAMFAVSAQAQTVKVSFRSADDMKSMWPFSEQKFTREPAVTEATVTLKKTKHMFEFESETAMYLNSKFGFMFGGAAGNYVKLPAIKGKTLTKISIKFGGKGAVGKLAVTDAKGNVYEGGKAAVSPALNHVHTWEVSGIKKGKPAYLTLTADSVVKMKELILEYE